LVWSSVLARAPGPNVQKSFCFFFFRKRRFFLVLFAFTPHISGLLGGDLTRIFCAPMRNATVPLRLEARKSAPYNSPERVSKQTQDGIARNA